MEALSLKEAQKKVDEWIKTYGVRYFNELTNMTILTEEVGELARIMARKYGEQSFKAGEDASKMADEMADVLFASHRVSSRKIEDQGFDFTYANICRALQNLYGKGSEDASGSFAPGI